MFSETRIGKKSTELNDLSEFSGGCEDPPFSIRTVQSFMGDKASGLETGQLRTLNRTLRL
jgi:hypothetical protein